LYSPPGIQLATDRLDGRLIVMRARLLKAAAIVLLVPGVAAAQGRMPHRNASGVGADVGVFMPSQDGMKSGPAIGGFFEHYLDARNSLRLGAGWENPKQEENHDATMRQVRLNGDLVHNWEGGTIHPFVGAGIGVYFLQPRVNGTNLGDSATKVGGTLLGGLEFFTSKTFSVKGEAQYRFVQKSGDYDPSGLALTIGVKGYF
jgi:hypothetical protein